MLDPENSVVKLCAASIQAEAEHRFDDAAAFAQQAWDARQNNWESCIAAHYLARHQRSLERILFWNQEALRHAEASMLAGAKEQAIVVPFYPSLYLNLGKSHEELGDLDAARDCYTRAADALDELESSAGSHPPKADGGYAKTLRHAITRAMRRTADVANRSSRQVGRRSK